MDAFIFVSPVRSFFVALFVYTDWNSDNGRKKRGIEDYRYQRQLRYKNILSGIDIFHIKNMCRMLIHIKKYVFAAESNAKIRCHTSCI